MGLLRKTKLYWAAVDTANIVGYRLYWASGTQVDTSCDFIEVGPVTETAIPDRVRLAQGPVMFGITAIDRTGHESEMTTLAQPFDPKLPLAPSRLFLKPSNAFCITPPPKARHGIRPELIQRLIAPMADGDLHGTRTKEPY